MVRVICLNGFQKKVIGTHARNVAVWMVEKLNAAHNDANQYFIEELPCSSKKTAKR